jgi:hypothetical protein
LTLVYHIVSFPILCGNEYCSSYCSSPLLWFCVNTVCLCLFVPLPKHYFWHGFSEFVSNTATISYSIKNFKKMISTCNIWWHGNYSMKLQYEITTVLTDIGYTIILFWYKSVGHRVKHSLQYNIHKDIM